MDTIYTRILPLIGKSGVEKLRNSHVAVFGIGGVGGICAESLARSGIGKITVVDNDVVQPSNLNRQTVALLSTMNRKKVDVIRERLLDINSDIVVKALDLFYLPASSISVDFSKFDYIIDAVDNVTAKLDIVQKATAQNIPVLSCMGTAFRLDPTKLVVADIYSTSVCPLCRVMRRELRKRDILSLKVVYSTECCQANNEIMASMIFVPSSAGLLLAKTAIEDLIAEITE